MLAPDVSLSRLNPFGPRLLFGLPFAVNRPIRIALEARLPHQTSGLFRKNAIQQEFPPNTACRLQIFTTNPISCGRIANSAQKVTPSLGAVDYMGASQCTLGARTDTHDRCRSS